MADLICLIPSLSHHLSKSLSPLPLPPNSDPLSVNISLGFPCISIACSSTLIIFSVVLFSNICIAMQYLLQSSNIGTTHLPLNSVPSNCHMELGVSLSNLIHFNLWPCILLPLDNPVSFIIFLIVDSDIKISFSSSFILSWYLLNPVLFLSFITSSRSSA